jgi:hypothetical protein
MISVRSVSWKTDVMPLFLMYDNDNCMIWTIVWAVLGIIVLIILLKVLFGLI